MNTPPIVSKFDSIYRLYSDVVSIQEKNGNFTAYDKDGKEVSINMTDVDADFAKIDYKNKRYAQYPNWQEQFDMLYKDIVAGKLDETGTWATHIKAIKDANPKP